MRCVDPIELRSIESIFMLDRETLLSVGMFMEIFLGYRCFFTGFCVMLFEVVAIGIFLSWM